MAKKLKRFKEMKQFMTDLIGYKSDEKLATDLGITARHLRYCISNNKIPYGVTVKWALKHHVNLEILMLKEV